MPKLTRRRYPEAREECWHLYYGDVHAGTIAIRTAIPQDEDPWEWACGFYPGSHPGEHQSGTSPSFDEARANFEHAWRVFLSKRTEADFRRGAISGTGPRESTLSGMQVRRTFGN